tara:strand:- start:139 stop:378 length:240 start_codon:yes stop_codon:yes gene_type:complete
MPKIIPEKQSGFIGLNIGFNERISLHVEIREFEYSPTQNSFSTMHRIHKYFYFDFLGVRQRSHIGFYTIWLFRHNATIF